MVFHHAAAGIEVCVVNIGVVMRHPIVQLLLLGSVLLSVFGCGDDRRGGGGGPGSGVPGSTRLVDLSNDQRTQLCDWEFAYCTDGLVTGTCDSSTTRECIPPIDCEPFLRLESDRGFLRSTCTATVSQEEACHRASVSQPCTSALDLPACDALDPCF